MQDTLKGIISDLHVFLYGGFRSLPLVMGGTMLILGLFTANYAMIFLLLGFLVLSPMVAAIINVVIPVFCNLIYYVFVYIFSSKNEYDTMNKNMEWTELTDYTKNQVDVCNLNIPFLTDTSPASNKKETIVSSPWMAMMSFFIGYVIHNAVQLYTVDASADMNVVTNSTPADINVKVRNRKSQAMSALVSTVIIGIIILALRFWGGCELYIGFVLTLAVFGAGGYFWYALLSGLGQDRLSDIFGIANRILPPSAIQNGPIACVPIPAS